MSKFQIQIKMFIYVIALIVTVVEGTSLQDRGKHDTIGLD